VLAGSLLLVLAYGLLQSPEVRGWYSPNYIWEMKIDQLQKEFPRIRRKIKSTEAILETVNDDQRKNLPMKSWNARLYKVQKDCITIGIRAKYFNAKVAALKTAMERRIQEASTPEVGNLLGQIKQLELRGSQNSFALEYTLVKLRTAKLAQANLTCGQFRGGPGQLPR
jgi:hypothetical protein